jgi:5-aminolevulinate synthase
VLGGYIAGSAAMCDFVRSFASGFIFTTALPPAVAAGAKASRQPPEAKLEMERQRQRRNGRQAARQARRRTASRTCPTPSHIVPVMVGDPVKCKMRSATSCWTLRDLRPADQLPDRAQGHRAAALHALPLHTDADIDHAVAARRPHRRNGPVHNHPNG